MSPDLRTLPSTRWTTPSFCPISCAVAFLPLNENAEVRAATCIPGIFWSTVSNSSLTPSEKYSLPLSSLRLTKGRTATDFWSGAFAGADGVACADADCWFLVDFVHHNPASSAGTIRTAVVTRRGNFDFFEARGRSGVMPDSHGRTIRNSSIGNL